VGLPPRQTIACLQITRQYPHCRRGGAIGKLLSVLSHAIAGCAQAPTGDPTNANSSHMVHSTHSRTVRRSYPRTHKANCHSSSRCCTLPTPGPRTSHRTIPHAHDDDPHNRRRARSRDSPSHLRNIRAPHHDSRVPHKHTIHAPRGTVPHARNHGDPPMPDSGTAA
jgi:hypothetical protein